MQTDLIFLSDDPILNEGFQWAKAQALAYVFQHEPLGDWYEAALPGRSAFCMRDVAHQASGAHLLGLADHTYNMLHHFAENISEQRDWCTFWEIDQRGLPCPADYQDDSRFWYNLPANFDVIDCCLRQFQWTGRPGYRTDPAMVFFYQKSVDEYVRAWDRDGDGLLEHRPTDAFRGIATYDEQVEHPLMGSDLLAAQYAGYRACAELLEQGKEGAGILLERAEALRKLYDQAWWNPDSGYYHSYRSQDGAFCPGFHGPTNLFSLYFNLIQNPIRLSRTLDQVIEQVPLCNLEARTYLPETLFRFGRIEAAYQEMLALFSPSLARREYPEVSFALIGALGTGLMGLAPQASLRQIGTLPRSVGWAELVHVPFIDAALTVRHEGQHTTHFTLQDGGALTWRAAFPGNHTILTVDGQSMPARQTSDFTGSPESCVLLRVNPGETHRVSTQTPASSR